MKRLRLLWLVLPVLLGACDQANRLFNSEVTLPKPQLAFLDQLRRGEALIPDSLNDDRKQFLQDSLRGALKTWMSENMGMKVENWIGVVKTDTANYGLGRDYKGLLELDFPLHSRGDSTNIASTMYLIMSVDRDDPDMLRAREEMSNGDTVVFSGYFKSVDAGDRIGRPSGFVGSVNLDFTPTELHIKRHPEKPAPPEPDTAGSSKSPVSVTAVVDAKMVGSSRVITVIAEAKNVSNKKISKLSVRFMVLDKNGQPATVNGARGVWQRGYLSHDIAPGASDFNSWQFESQDGEQVKLIYPKEVTYYNGIKWKVGKH